MTAIPDPQRAREKAHIGRLRGAAARMADDAWLLEASRDGMRLIVQRGMGEQTHVATIHRAATDDERDVLCGGLDNLRLFFALFDRAATAVRDLQQQVSQLEAHVAELSKPKGDYAAQAAMLCQNSEFWRFMTGKSGMPVHDKGSADKALKKQIDISSKTQLSADDSKLADFRSLVGEFEAWKRGGAQ
ncbi:hypothetical protein [Rhizobium oryziradicis]|uniref:Uncharacterized protein n=1 Tax=Rhizobium oryziradicis TaxID=1867956 RepID=A0A1Q8ZQB9_9HYPH|nr:hypothetical protein [Rhizobium oryziradicis]OLP44140.1 hypothetical protein BJF95_06130 [Rhizobium oryziradicis]